MIKTYANDLRKNLYKNSIGGYDPSKDHVFQYVLLKVSYNSLSQYSIFTYMTVLQSKNGNLIATNKRHCGR
jgi:hypothetical protein